MTRKGQRYDGPRDTYRGHPGQFTFTQRVTLAPMSWHKLNRDIVNCSACARLRAHCADIAARKRRAFADWEYWGKPVPNFGRSPAKLLIVGLAPAAHGANRTGRMFTGDRSGDWLYRAMHRAGFASQAEARDRSDAMELHDCVITAACHCAPPDNKPTRDEMENCRPWLTRTFELVQPRVVLALGQIGWKAALDELIALSWYQGRRPKFGHGAEVELTGDRFLLGSYHPSQQNTFTGRLTEAMLDGVFAQARQRIAG